jgi:hypothetical protein
LLQAASEAQLARFLIRFGITTISVASVSRDSIHFARKPPCLASL